MSRTREPLAVVGIGCRLPGRLNSAAGFWRGLLDGVDAITEVPSDRWSSDALFDPDPAKAGHMRTRRGGFLADIDQFDAEFFDIFPAAATQMDPQQRMLLEVAYETFEDAGATLDELVGSRTGVFIGTFVYDYHCMQLESSARDRIVGHSAMGSGMASIANRLSYSFDLRGPSLMLDTYCSSSLVALHLACRSIWDGDADAAIAGGVNAILRPEFAIALSKAGFLSPDGACKAFDASANGYVRSEGTGLVYLKPLSAALAHGDRIHALVLGSAVNQDGFVADGFTVPSLPAQVAMLQAAYRDAGVDPHQVAYVEAHGPGTVVGDPIEAKALGTVLGQGRDPRAPLLVGSVKTNLGHLEGAAGIAGFIKGTLVAKHGRVPPNLHFKQPNPAIDFEGERIRIATQVTELPSEHAPFLIGVNSFGAGGTNAHLVLRQHRPSADAGARAPRRTKLFTLSAKSPPALSALAGAHANHIESSEAPLADIAYSQHRRRSRLPHQLYVYARNRAELLDKLRRFQRGESVEGTSTHHIAGGLQPKLAFVYSGQGGQWAGMGAALMEAEPVFREQVEAIDRLFRPLAGWSLIDEIGKPKTDSRIDDTKVVQPAIMTIQVALTALFRHYGVRPAGIVGHSIGEVAAAYAAGAIDLPTAVAVIYHRSRIQDRATDKGKMLAVGIDHQRARRLLLGLEDRVSIAGINAPEMLTLAGDADALASLSAELEGQGVFSRFVNVRVPYHSHLMEPLRGDLLEALAPFAGNPTDIALYSTVTGERAPGTHLDGRYWYENVRKPVLFAPAFTRMLEDGYSTFIEIGPHPVLGGPAKTMIAASAAKAVATAAMTRGESTDASFWLALAAWMAAGGSADDRKLFGDEPRYVELPTYRWQHRRYWSEAADSKQLRHGTETHPFLRSSSRLVTEPDREVWKARVDVASHPFLKDHEVDGAIVLPATAHLELAHAIARRSLGTGEISLRDLRFHSALVQPDADREPYEVRFEMTGSDGYYAICSRRPDETDAMAWTRHSTGRIDLFGDARVTEDVDLATARRAFGDEDELRVDQFYAHRRASGLVYGKRFQCVEQLWQRGPRILAKLRLGPELRHESDRLLVHPALLDAAIHATFAAVHATEEPERPYLPHHIERVTFFGTLPAEAWSLVRVNRLDADILAGDAWIFDANGRLIVEFNGLTCRHVPDGSGAADELTRGLYEHAWRAVTDHGGAHEFAQEVKTCIITGHAGPLASAVSTQLRSHEPAIEVVELPIRTAAPDAAAPAPWLARLDDSSLDGRTHLLYFAPAHAWLTEAMDGAEVKAKLVGLAMPLLELLQAVMARGGVPKVYLITAGAEALAGDRVVNPAHTLLQGLGRVLDNECPNVPFKLIDTSPTFDAAEVSGVCQEVLLDRLDADESEVALRHDRRYLSQLQALSADDAQEPSGRERRGVRTVAATDAEYRAEVDGPARVTFRDIGTLTLGERDVEIAVAAAAVSNRDVQRVVAGADPGEPTAGLGRSVAGRVTRVGRRVDAFNVGDEVIASVSEGLAGRVVTPADCVAAKPTHLSFTRAAALPASYLGGLYAVRTLARLSRTETLLVVGDADGVGLAASHVALRLGARIIAAPDPGASAPLRRLGDAVIECSQNKMHEQVLALTDGNGVDVVLNFGAGRLATQGLRCLKPFGRFVELRKPDSYLGQTLSIRCMQNNLSYFAVDLEDLARQRSDLQAELMGELAAFFRDGAQPPEEVEEFPMSDLKGALKRAGQTGRFAKAVAVTSGDTIEVWPSRRWRLRGDRTYLVTGGASGLGLRIAQRMVERGARRLLLVSRSGTRALEDERIVQEMRSRGAHVELVSVDVADSAAVRRLFDGIAASGVALAGIVHAAAVMDDVALANMTADRFAGPLAPKAVGAWNLHLATREQELEFFVCLSSISSVLGLAGTLNYASANRFVEGLMAYRRLRGLAGSTLALGVLGDYAGLSRSTPENRHMLDLLEGQGFRRMRLEDVLAKLELTIVERSTNRLAALIDWSRFANAHPHLTRNTRLAPALASSRDRKGRAAGGRLSDRLKQLPRTEALEELLARVIENLGRMLGLPPEQIGRTDSIDRFGLDSIMLAQLSSWFLRELDLGIPFMRLLRGPTLVELCEELLERLQGSAATQSDGGADEVVSLSESDGVRAVGKWLIRGKSTGPRPVRLFCFHSMGIGASLFTPFLLNPPETVEPFAIQTPGREDRSDEALVSNLAVLVEKIQTAVAPHLDRPAIFWGHSFGGIVAFEVLCSLRRRGLPTPDHLLLTGTAAPHLVSVWQKRDVLQRVTVEENSNQYLMSISRYLDDPTFVARLLPLMRRDLPLLMTYRFIKEAPLAIPITAYTAVKDDMVYKDEVEAWRGYTTRSFDLKLVDGDHWFLQRQQAEIRAELTRIAEAVVAATAIDEDARDRGPGALAG